MRLELQAILWVTAIALATLGLSLSDMPKGSLDSPREFDHVLVPAGPEIGAVAAEGPTSYTPELRPIFGVAAIPQQVAAMPTAVPIRTKIVLQGILSASGVRKALLNTEGSVSNYLLVQQGDIAFGFYVDAISEDEVEIRGRHSWIKTTLILRGGGELP